MKKVWKKIAIIALAAVLPGIVLLVIGIATGGPKPVLVSGGKVMVDEVRSVTEDLANFSRIQVDISSIDVVIRAGDRDSITYPHHEATYANPTWNISDDTLVVTLQDRSATFDINLWTSYSNDIVITYDSSRGIDQVISNVTVGDQDITGDIATVKTTATTGDTTITGAIDAIEASTTTGEIEVRGTVSNLTATTTTGDIDVEGTVKTSALTVTTGSIEADIGQSAADCSYDLHTDTGDVQVETTSETVLDDGQADGRHGPTESAQKTVPGGTCSVTGKATTGDIDLVLLP
jgi:DUF4097 and DUF4098 domain-containing protein YvlB